MTQGNRTSAVRAITLVELLVVMMVIVVLLAILSSALAEAIYQAELATCATNQKTIGNGILSYAAQYKRRYPDLGVNPPTTTFVAGAPTGEYRDIRPMIRDYISINKNLHDPLTKKVDRDTDNEPNEVMAGYSIFWNWRIKDEKGMSKIGDKWTYQGARFDLLLGDRSVYTYADLAFIICASHPDSKGVLKNTAVENSVVNPYGPSVDLGRGSTFSFWDNFETNIRGSQDNNYTHDDGSVTRLNSMKQGDERVTAIPEVSDPDNPLSELKLRNEQPAISGQRPVPPPNPPS